jgi:UDP-glucose 4-epimerase
MFKKYILVTGGAGYIGSHICLELYNTYKNYNIIIVDRVINDNIVIQYLKDIIGDKLLLFEVDLLNYNDIFDIFNTYEISYVIHLAGYKSVSESIYKPILYYNNNITSTLNLLECMKKFNCFNLIFSSSCCVYGCPDDVPVNELSDTNNKQLNPYANTKIFIEKILEDLCKTSIFLSDRWKIVILRYFNPVGAHMSGKIGDFVKPHVPNNLFLNILENYKNKNKFLFIYGHDYNTKDGTCIRDFIHIEDIASAHTKSIAYINTLNNDNDIYNVHIFNIGTGNGYTVKEVMECFNKHTNNGILYTLTKRREGDIEVSYTDNKKATEILKWYPKYNLDDMVKSSLDWCKTLEEHTKK